jgi:hypothetical protein
MIALHTDCDLGGALPTGRFHPFPSVSWCIGRMMTCGSTLTLLLCRTLECCVRTLECCANPRVLCEPSSAMCCRSATGARSTSRTPPLFAAWGQWRASGEFEGLRILVEASCDAQDAGMVVRVPTSVGMVDGATETFDGALRVRLWRVEAGVSESECARRSGADPN